LSPSQNTLYVSDSNLNVVKAYDINPDGTISNGRVFIDANLFGRLDLGTMDGMKVDQSGYVFASGLGGVFVFAPDGTHVGSIEMNTGVSNVGWGDDGTVLYIDTNDKVYRVQTSTKGVGF
jgi:gluconolactonase